MRLSSELEAPSDSMRSCVLAMLTPDVNVLLLMSARTRVTKIGLGGWMNDSSPKEVATRPRDDFRGTKAKAVAEPLSSE